jgi:hypothetical protein
MPNRATRALLSAALNGPLAKCDFCRDPNVGVDVPMACPGVDAGLLGSRGHGPIRPPMTVRRWGWCSGARKISRNICPISTVTSGPRHVLTHQRRTLPIKGPGFCG